MREAPRIEGKTEELDYAGKKESDCFRILSFKTQPSHQPLLPGWVCATLKEFQREALTDLAWVTFLSLI